MADNMNDLLANVKKMVDSGNIPNDIKQMMNNFQGSSNNSNNLNNSNNNNNNLNNILNQVSPEMLNNLGSILNNQSNNSSNDNSNNFNIDMNTIMKMQNIMGNMNNKNDPRANLLYSLKPYLRDGKKDKLNQYINLLNISKVAELMNKKDDNKNE